MSVEEGLSSSAKCRGYIACIEAMAEVKGSDWVSCAVKLQCLVSSEAYARSGKAS